MEIENPEKEINIILLGDSSTGKSSFLHQLFNKKFDERMQHTNGLYFKIKEYIIDGKLFKVQFCDVSGAEYLFSMDKSRLPSSDGFLVFYDISDEDSFHLIENWINFIQETYGNAKPIVIVGLKSDLDNEREVSKKEGKKFAKKNGFLFFEASSKTGENVEESVQEILDEIFQMKKLKKNFKEKQNYFTQFIDENLPYFDTDDKFFSYNRKLYGFNFESFIYYSKYFHDNMEELSKNKIINLFDNHNLEPNFSEDSILALIQYCKNRHIEITSSNVIEFKILSTKFEISSLKERINNYISKHWEEIIDDFFDKKIFNRNDNLYEYEQIISNNLIEILYRYENQLLDFPIAFLYRILSYYSQINKDSIDEPKIKEFVLKIIEKKWI